MIALMLTLYVLAVIVAVGSSAAGLVPLAVIAVLAMAGLCFHKEIGKLVRSG